MEWMLIFFNMRECFLVTFFLFETDLFLFQTELFWGWKRARIADDKRTMVSVVPPLHSAVSWGYCNNCGFLQGPEWRNSRQKMEAVARGWKTVVEVGSHSCGRNASSVLLEMHCCLQLVLAGCSQGSLWPKQPVVTIRNVYFIKVGLNTGILIDLTVWNGEAKEQVWKELS